MIPKLAISDPKMKPKPPPESPTDDLFHHRLENLIDLGHELTRLAAMIDRLRFDDRWGKAFCEVGRLLRPASSPACITSSTPRCIFRSIVNTYSGSM